MRRRSPSQHLDENIHHPRRIRVRRSGQKNHSDLAGLPAAVLAHLMNFPLCRCAGRLALILAGLLAATTSDLSAAEVRVMSFNLWIGGEAGKQPLTQTAAVIRAAKADIVGCQETRGFEKDGRQSDNGARLAQLLGWHYFDQGEGMGILSRFPIVTNTPAKWGVALRLPSGQVIHMFNAHLMHAPYQPYQLLNIPYANAPFVGRRGKRSLKRARPGALRSNVWLRN